MKCVLPLFLFPLIAGAAPAPILFYDFNEPGLTEASKGSEAAAIAFRNNDRKEADLHGDAGQGVTGADNDGALDLSESTAMGAAGHGGLAVIKPAPIGDLKSFTVCGWIKPATDIGDKARLFEATAGNDGLVVLCGPQPGALGLMVNGRGGPGSPEGAYSGQDKWIFFAITYDSTSTQGTATYYVGSPAEAVTQIGTSELPAGSVAATSSPAYVGNSGGFERPFKGLMDNFRLFGSMEDGSGALEEAEIEAIRAGDLKKQ